MKSHPVRLLGLCFVLAVALPLTFAQAPPDANALDRKLIDEARKDSPIMANLTHLSDVIGPRLTGSANLKKANEWGAEKMKEYGLTNIKQEAWSMPEGWERGTATLRLLEPDNGRTLSVASLGWYPGTNGKVQGDVVYLKASNAKELEQYKGKLKNAIVLTRPPVQLASVEQFDKPGSIFAGPGSPSRPFEGGQLSQRERSDFLAKEGAAAVLLDSPKPLGLIVTTGGWSGNDRPSASNRLPTLYVAHNHYELLYRLATRPDGAKTRAEIEVSNKFIAGPIAVHNTVGEIKGTDKADEFVVVGAHLDSWDLAQGTTDNGTGTCVILETARILVKSGARPRRTIRFVLFTGEEQGLFGSKYYVEQHKDEMPKTSVCMVHDTGTGKVNAVGARNRPGLRSLLETELSILKELGVKDFAGGFTGGSDHASFDRAGVPGFGFEQELAGYRFSHHTQADTLDRAIEGNLIQGAQVMAISALRIANMEKLLPRERGTGLEGRRFEPDDLGKIVRVADPQISPDGKSVVVVVSRPNYEKNRFDAELVLVDVASGKQRVLTFERLGVGQPRWSPDGQSLAFLSVIGAGKDAKHQLHVMPMAGGDARRITSAPMGVQHYAWKPDGKEIAFASPDEPANKADAEKGLDAFEVGNDSFLITAAPTPSHVWLVTADGTTTRRVTSGTWGLETAAPPSSPSSPLCWSPDGKSLLIVRQEKPNTGDRDKRTIQVLDVASGKSRPLTGAKLWEGTPSFSPDGSQVAYWYPRGGDPVNITEVHVADPAGGAGRSLTRNLDRCLYLSLWFPDGKSLLVGGHDVNRVSLWAQPLDAPAKKLDLGSVHPSWSFNVDATVSKQGAIAFTGSESRRPTELYWMESPTATPRRLTDFNKDVAAMDLGKVETISWKGPDDFDENGIVVYPPGFTADRKYPLVLLIHGGPRSTSTEAFSAWAQLIASRGYVVFLPNYRGSDNMGNAFQRAIYKDQGDGPGRDVMAGVEALKKRGFIDEKRMAVTGWSYGGYMTTWLIGHYDVWKTAIAGAAVTDWRDQYNLGDTNVTRRFQLAGSPWLNDGEKLYREQSPISFAKNIKTPTLIVATTGDARVPITQSFQLYRALKDNDVPVTFVAYPIAGHSPADPVRQKDVFRRWVTWLDEHLK